MDEIIVVGGVVPSLLVDQAKAQEPHVGTTDLDLALSLSVLDEEKYRDISGRLRDAGFKPVTKADGKIVRQTWEMTGKLGRISIDFLIPRSDKAAPKRLLQDLEKDFGAIRTRGLEIAFVDRRSVEIDGPTIEGDLAKRTVQVAGVGAMLVPKAFAFDNRGAEKDAYDIFTCCMNLEWRPRSELSSDVSRIRITSRTSRMPSRCSSETSRTATASVQGRWLGS